MHAPSSGEQREDHQIADSSVMSVQIGAVNFNADQAVHSVNNTGGTVTVVNSNVTAGDSTLIPRGGAGEISTAARTRSRSAMRCAMRPPIE